MPGVGYLLAVLGLLLVSAFASSSETAFFSLNRFQLRRLRERYRDSYGRIRTLLAHPSRLLILILLINEIVNVTFSSLVAEMIQKNSGLFFNNPLFSSPIAHTPEREWLLATIMTLFVTLPTLLLVGEITPKVVAAKMNRIVALLNSRLLIVIYKLIFPLLWVLDAGITFTLRKFKAEGRDHLSKTMSVLSEEDFMLLMEEGHKEGTVAPKERRLITNVLEFDDSTVAEVMTPITQTFCVSAAAPIAEALPDIRSQKYSRIPVYQKNRRHIVGILYIKDLLALRTHPNLMEVDVKSLMAAPMFVGPNMRLSVLFRRLKEEKTHMAVVVGEGDEAVGLVTMEDVLESIFGEISDERDVTTPPPAPDSGATS